MIRIKSISLEIKSRPDIISFLNGQEDISRLFDLPVKIPIERINIYKQLYRGIGNTSCYKVNLPNNNVLHVKMEYANSGGNSHYSRFWIPYLFIAEALDLIHPGETHIIEVTSGSAGIALSEACKQLGFPLTLIVPEVLPKVRIEPMENNGADLIRVKGYIGGCISKLREMLIKNGYFPTNHSEEKADVLVKIDKRIAVEYFEQYGPPDYAIIGLGNGTSTYAIFDYFRQVAGESTKRITYYPRLDSGQIIFGLYGPNVKLRHVPMALDLAVDCFYTDDIDLSEIKAIYQFDTEISNLGASSLYAIAIARKIAEKVENKTFLTIGYDKSDRYDKH